MSAHLTVALPLAAAPPPFRPLHPAFGREAFGLDLARTQPEAALDRLAAALAEHQLLLLRDQRLNRAQLGALVARLAGAGQPPTMAELAPGDLAQWTFDPAAPRRPARVQALLAAAAPAAGLTGLFASQVAALAALHPWLAHRIEYLEAVTADGPVPLVRVDPATSRRSLHLPAATIAIAGLAEAEAAALLPRLRAAATAPAVTWRLGLRQGDLLLWDGHAVQHRLALGQAGPQAPLLRAATQPAAPLGAAAAGVPFLIAG